MFAWLLYFLSSITLLITVQLYPKYEGSYKFIACYASLAIHIILTKGAQHKSMKSMKVMFAPPGQFIILY